MNTELCLDFTQQDHVVISLDGKSLGAIPFVNPLTATELDDIASYFETYAIQMSCMHIDPEAVRISSSMRGWGKALFDAVFDAPAARQLFDEFTHHALRTPTILTIIAKHPSIHALPWELLRDSTSDAPKRCF